jgi:hypothetical protein
MARIDPVVCDLAHVSAMASVEDPEEMVDALPDPASAASISEKVLANRGVDSNTNSSPLRDSVHSLSDMCGF